LKVIPVIDVLNGIAVHAVRGEREHYRPLKSVLCGTANPLGVALAFKTLGFESLYLADLDAILENQTNFALYERIKTETNLDLMVDAGIADIQKATRVLDSGASKIVIGTETLEDLSFVERAVSFFGKNHVLVSIDMRKGKVISVSENLKSMNPVSLAQKLEEIDVEQVILLDLNRVGTSSGVNVGVLKDVLKETKLKVLVGGGVRNLQDLERLRKLGVYGALIATALHNGKIEVDMLKSAGFH